MAESSAATATPVERFGRAIERRDGLDFPYYNGIPVHVATWKWIVVILACAVGFAVLVLTPQPNQLIALVPRALFTGIPLVVFATLVRPQWRAIFRRVRAVDVLTMIVFWALNLAVSALVASLVKAIFGATQNTATSGISEGGPVNVIAFYVGTGVQLMGEELFTILPFLALLTWLHHAGMSRKSAIILSWLITAVWFGAAHLPTYGWNIAQALLVIGVARLVLTLAFIRTKNVWVSFGAHVLNDWSTFTLVLLTGVVIGGS